MWQLPICKTSTRALTISLKCISYLKLGKSNLTRSHETSGKCDTHVLPPPPPPRLDVCCSSNLPTQDLETEVFVHILHNCMEYVAGEGDPDPGAAAAAAFAMEGDGMAR